MTAGAGANLYIFRQLLNNPQILYFFYPSPICPTCTIRGLHIMDIQGTLVPKQFMEEMCSVKNTRLFPEIHQKRKSIHCGRSYSKRTLNIRSGVTHLFYRKLTKNPTGSHNLSGPYRLRKFFLYFPIENIFFINTPYHYMM